MRKLSILLSITLLFFLNASGQKVKKVTKRSGDEVISLEEYFVIKRGKHKGKRHGPYTLSKYGIEISGKYAFGEKHGKWHLYEDGLVEYYSNGVLDSTLIVDRLKAISLSQTDTLMYNFLYPNGYQYEKLKDTIFVFKSKERIPIGKVLNGKKEGHWLWETEHFKTTGQFAAGTRVGSHKTYYKNGQLLCSMTFDEAGYEDGQIILFYPNGDTASIQSYEAGELNGIVKSWYPNGQLCYSGLFEEMEWTYYQEFFENGTENLDSSPSSKTSNISSTSFIPPGSKYYNCKALPELFPVSNLQLAPFTSKAEFPGGDIGLQRYLAENTHYPKEAVQNNEQGSALVMFTVNLIGEVENISIINSNDISYYLQAEAIRVIKSSSYYWTPATQNGFPVKMRFRIPIKFQNF